MSYPKPVVIAERVERIAPCPECKHQSRVTAKNPTAVCGSCSHEFVVVEK